MLCIIIIIQGEQLEQLQTIIHSCPPAEREEYKKLVEFSKQYNSVALQIVVSSVWMQLWSRPS